MKFSAVKEKCVNFIKKYEFGHVLQFALTNGIIWMLMSLMYLKYINLMQHSAKGIFYSVVFGIGHFGVFSAGLWLVTQLCRFLGRKFYTVMSVIIGGTFTFFIFSDIVVYALYRFHINIPMITLFCSPAAFELVEIPWTMGVMTFLITAGIYVGEYFLLKGVFKIRFFKSSLALLLAILLCFGVFNGMHAWAAFSGEQELMLRTEALPLKYALTATRFFMKRGYKPAQRIKVAVGSTIKYPLAPLEFEKQEKPKNVILILVDSLRADMFSPEVMPNLWQMSETLPATRFTQHFSGGNCTKTGVFSLFYGISGNYFDQALRSGVGSAMVDSMLKLGYDVKVFSSGTLASPPFNRTIFTNVPDIEINQPGSSKIERDQIVIGKCADYLNNRDPEKPYFIFLFLDSVHGTAVPDDFSFKFATPMKKMNFLALGSDEKTRKDAVNLIKNSCFYMDGVLADFFKKVDMPARIRENTVVIFTSDHGNEAAETQMRNWGHNSNFARFQTQSPLVVFGLDHPEKVINYRTGGMDVSATVMQEVLGCKNPIRDYSMGFNLFDPQEREYLISSSYLENAVIFRNKVFVQTVYGVVQKYDLDGNFIDDPLPAPVIKKFFDMSAAYSR